MPIAAATVLTTILTAGEVAGAIGAISAVVPTNAKTVDAKYRSTVVVIENHTQFDIDPINEYFDSGRNYQGPKKIKSFSEGIFTAVNKDTSFMTGVSGGKSFTIGDKNGDLAQFSVGFSNPAIGARKVSVINGDNPKLAYELIEPTMARATSSSYVGKDSKGNPINFKFKYTFIPGDVSVLTVTQTY